MDTKIVLSPIGHFECDSIRKSELPRQASRSSQKGRVNLKPGCNFDQAIEGIEGFKKIWLVYYFHQSQSWKPKVLPQNSEKKVGVFATRSPYRPNSIGMSCVDLEAVDGRVLHVSGHDILDGSPILDIKPYLSYADSFSELETLKESCWWQGEPKRFNVLWLGAAKEKSDWLIENAHFDISRAVETQLSMQPKQSSKKRIVKKDHHWQLAIKTWRVIFSIHESEHNVKVLDVHSAYGSESSGFSLLPPQAEAAGEENSIEIHKKFISLFNSL